MECDSRKKTCGVFTNIAPLYSKPLWDELSLSKKVDYFFYSSRNGYSGIKTIDINESRSINEKGKYYWKFLRNIYYKDLLIYQVGIVKELLSTNYDAYILNGEMHIISNWFAVIICKIRRKPILLWGHGIYGNEKCLKKAIRHAFNRIASSNLVYGKRAGILMINSGINSNKVFTVYNSLDFNTHMKHYEDRDDKILNRMKTILFPVRSELPIVIFIGRLTKEKKISILLEAIQLSKKKGNSYNCLIVGGGQEYDNLKYKVNYLDINDLVCFYGPSYDEMTNSNLIMLADCCVSPGNVGLTAIHSMSLGTPVITHGNMFNQGPEAEAIIPEKTGLYFKENDIDSLSDAIDDLILNRKKLLMETNCINQIKEFWNPMKQAAAFDKAVLNSISGS
jgi:glycosyltransferase involved in cell wall biosynthesis